MKGLNKDNLITIIIILVVLIIAGMILLKGDSSQTDKEISKCIGQNAELYTQVGCHACEKQKEMFGNNYEYLTIIDCFFEREKCGKIRATPTWIINEEEYLGVQSIETLKELTGC